MHGVATVLRIMRLLQFLTVALCLSLSATSSQANLVSDRVGNPKSHEAVDEDKTIPERLMEDLQRDFHLSERQAAGIVGNLAHETGNFRVLKQIGGSCYGYPQWCGPRRAQFDRYAARAGGRASYAANYGFLKHELETGYKTMLEKIRDTDSMEAAGQIFMRDFLRPNMRKANTASRMRYAQSYVAGNFAGAGCYSEQKLEAAHRPAPC